MKKITSKKAIIALIMGSLLLTISSISMFSNAINALVSVLMMISANVHIVGAVAAGMLRKIDEPDLFGRILTWLMQIGMLAVAIIWYVGAFQELNTMDLIGGLCVSISIIAVAATIIVSKWRKEDMM